MNAAAQRRFGLRLYWRIWFAVSATIVVFALAVGALWHFFFDPLAAGPVGEPLAATIAESLPARGEPKEALQRALARWRRRAALDLAVFEADGSLVAQVGAPLPAPGAGAETHHFLRRRPFDESHRHAKDRWRPAFAYQMADGRWLVLRREFARRGPPFGPLTSLALLAAAVGLGAYPVVRRLTRRLERLQAGVERLGRGDLAARVPVEGRDEVAQLAASFNDAAARIERLVAAQRALLANASHELRSPLARVRMAVELLQAEARPDLKEELKRDIAELDALIDEILLAGRLDAANGTAALAANFEDVDLTALAAEECARAGAAFDGAPVTVRGDARLLRRLVRNLLDNARRYGGAARIEVTLALEDGSAVLAVADRGPGVPADERERIFEPFYRARGAAEAAGGVGLGLALVRKIAERHGGAATCEARAGGGSVFKVRLPR